MNKKILVVYGGRINEIKEHIVTHLLNFDTEGVEEKCRHANCIMSEIHHLNTIVDSLEELKLITNEESFGMKEQIYFISKEYACSVNDKMGRTILDVDYEDFIMFEEPMAREKFQNDFYKNDKPICNY